MPETIIELMDAETGYGNAMAANKPGVMIASVYDKSASDSSPNQYFKSKINEILAVNPWFMGRFKNIANPKGVKPKTRLAVIVDEETSNHNEYFNESTNDEVFSDEIFGQSFDYNKLCAKLMNEKYLVPDTKRLWDKPNGKFFKSGIIENSSKTKIILFISGNHTMFDGCTLYNVWKQLDPKIEPFFINPVRMANFDEEMEKNMSIVPEGMKMKEYYGGAFMGWAKAVLRKGFAQSWKGCKVQEHLVEFDSEKIGEIKNKYKTENSFVSTNDVLTSWFRTVIPKARNIMMAINIRERLPGTKMTDGGNYLIAPWLCHDDLETPVHVRNWLNKRITPGNGYPMLGYADFKPFIGGVFTNWSSFYHHVELEGCKQIIHCPVINMNSDVGPFKFGIEMYLIYFQCNKNQFAGYFVSKRKEMTLEKVVGMDLVKCKLEV